MVEVEEIEYHMNIGHGMLHLDERRVIERAVLMKTSMSSNAPCK